MTRGGRTTAISAVVIGVVVLVAGVAFATTRDNGGESTPTNAANTPSFIPESTAASVPVVQFRKPTDRRPLVLYTGDSLTGGNYASKKALAFPTLVSAAIGDVKGVSATRADQTLSTVAGITSVPSGLDLAVIELGTNDIDRTPLPQFSQQYQDLTKHIRASSAQAAIVCLGTWNGQSGGYDGLIKQACEDQGGHFVSIARFFRDTSNRGPAGVRTQNGLSDDFHPNDRGHRAIATAILQAIGLA